MRRSRTQPFYNRCRLDPLPPESEKTKSVGSNFSFSVKNLVTFHHFSQLPTGHDVGDAPIRTLNAHDPHLGDQFTGPADHQHAILHGTLFFTDIKKHETPLWINH